MFPIPPARYILPNLVTLTASFCGFAIIWLAATAESAETLYLAAGLIPLACILDGFDGRVARWVHGQSRIGVQLDSMSDLLTFGVAPGFLVYFWALERLGFMGLVLSFVFSAAAMLRLARFNVMAEEDGGCTRYFSGLPAPMGGMGIATMVCLDVGILRRDSFMDEALPGVALFVVALALLMVSNVPFRTFKDLRFKPVNVLFVASVLVTVFVLSVQYDPLVALSIMFYGYFVANLLVALVFGRRIRASMAREAAASRLLVDARDGVLDESAFDEED